MHVDSIRSGAKVLIVDDLLATGGTAAAAAELASRQGGVVTGFAFVVEFDFLAGRKRIQDATGGKVRVYSARALRRGVSAERQAPRRRCGEQSGSIKPDDDERTRSPRASQPSDEGGEIVHHGGVDMAGDSYSPGRGVPDPAMKR